MFRFSFGPAAIASALLFAPAPTWAAEKLEGYFIAEQECEAYQSKNRFTNPGGMTTSIRRAYDMIAINKPGGDYFQIRIDGAPVTDARWVHTSCGVHVVAAETETAPVPPGSNPVQPSPGAESTDNLMTLSWQPSFCEIRPNKDECEALNAGNLAHATRQLSVHGLWPQPNGNFYCGVPNSIKQIDKPETWGDLPEVDLSDDLRDALNFAMPGTQSHLDRHEWIKHGTCYRGEGGAEEYYADTLLITDAVNSSPVGRFLQDHVGQTVTADDIRARFDEAFGAGAGEAVQVKCTSDQGRVLIGELWVHLKGIISPTADLGDLMRAASPVSKGCPQGFLDLAGLQ